MQRLSAVLVTLVLATGLSTAQEKNTGSCHRACLEGMVNQYLAAMVAHDASKAPFAKSAVFTISGRGALPWSTKSEDPRGAYMISITGEC
jgi:hypothetical protein